MSTPNSRFIPEAISSYHLSNMSANSDFDTKSPYYGMPLISKGCEDLEKQSTECASGHHPESERVHFDCPYFKFNQVETACRCRPLTPHSASEIRDNALEAELIENDQNSCFQEDLFGRKMLYVAAMNGNMEVIERVLKECPEALKELTSPGETCFHLAVLYNKTAVVERLVDWIEEECPEFEYLLNLGDYEGNTILHLATARKQLQTLRILTRCGLMDMNALNSGGFTALDIFHVLPCSVSKTDMEINMILREAGALRARDLKNLRIVKQREAVLLISTMLATITYAAAFLSNNSTSNNALTMPAPFILFNSVVFLVSVGIIIILLNEFEMKPWPQISVSALFGSYMCSIKAVSPDQPLTLLFLPTPILLLSIVPARLKRVLQVSGVPHKALCPYQSESSLSYWSPQCVMSALQK